MFRERGLGLPPLDFRAMDRRDILRRRLHNQRLRGTPGETPERVVRELAAMQAQEHAYAKWSVAQRTDGLSRAEVVRALAEGYILRTHVLRPTWHFVTAADIRWLLSLTAPRIHARNAHRYRELGLDDAVFARSRATLIRSLRGGRHLTRKEIVARFEEGGIAASGPRLAHLLMHAELEGVVCSGRLRGKQQTYALLEERAPEAGSLDRDEGLAELTHRYFTSRGPATLKDFGWWSSLTVAEVRRGVEMLGSELQSEVVEDRTYWFAGPPPPHRSGSPIVDLLQGYDEYIISYSESREVMFPPAAPRRDPVFMHAILLDGELIGHWRHALKRDQVVIETRLHRRLGSGAARALEAAVELYGRYLELPAVLA